MKIGFWFEWLSPAKRASRARKRLPSNARYKLSSTPAVALVAILSIMSLTSCGLPEGDPELAKNVKIELVDWHIVGLWVINCPVCWIRVTNYNSVPITNICFKYTTYSYDGRILTEGHYTMDKEDDVVQPFGAYANPKNFIEQFIGLVDLESDMLKIELVSVSQKEGGH